MNRILFFSAALMLTLLFTSCDKVTGSDKYDAVWTPGGDVSITKWTKPASVTDFWQFDKGFSFSTNAIKDSTVTLTFSPAIFQVENITSASGASVSFDAMITSSPDSVLLQNGSKVVHQFGVLGGTISTSGDSLTFSVKSFNGNASNTIALSVNPDSCSKVLRFNVSLQWNNFTGGTPQNALPTTKKIEVAIKNITMRVNGVNVIR